MDHAQNSYLPICHWRRHYGRIGRSSVISFFHIPFLFVSGGGGAAAAADSGAKEEEKKEVEEEDSEDSGSEAMFGLFD